MLTAGCLQLLSLSDTGIGSGRRLCCQAGVWKADEVGRAGVLNVCLLQLPVPAASALSPGGDATVVVAGLSTCSLTPPKRKCERGVQRLDTPLICCQWPPNG
jgi:hypothetical protein